MPHDPLLTPATFHKTSAEGKEQRNVLPTRIDTHKHATTQKQKCGGLALVLLHSIWMSADQRLTWTRG